MTATIFSSLAIGFICGLAAYAAMTHIELITAKDIIRLQEDRIADLKRRIAYLKRCNKEALSVLQDNCRSKESAPIFPRTV